MDRIKSIISKFTGAPSNIEKEREVSSAKRSGIPDLGSDPKMNNLRLGTLALTPDAQEYWDQLDGSDFIEGWDGDFSEFVNQGSESVNPSATDFSSKTSNPYAQPPTTSSRVDTENWDLFSPSFEDESSNSEDISSKDIDNEGIQKRELDEFEEVDLNDEPKTQSRLENIFNNPRVSKIFGKIAATGFLLSFTGIGLPIGVPLLFVGLAYNRSHAIYLKASNQDKGKLDVFKQSYKEGVFAPFNWLGGLILKMAQKKPEKDF